MLETGNAEKMNADLLISAKENSLVNSPFTVFLSDDIIRKEENGEWNSAVWKNKKAGTYLSAAQQRILYIDIFTNGKVQIRREE